MTQVQLVAMLDEICSGAVEPVRSAARRVSLSMRSDEPPRAEDLAVVLVHVLSGEASRRSAPKTAPPQPQTPEARQQKKIRAERTEPVARPRRSAFADQIRDHEQRLSEREGEEDPEIRRRFGVSSDAFGRRRKSEEG